MDLCIGSHTQFLCAIEIRQIMEAFERYHDNGQLMVKGNVDEFGGQEGHWVSYHSNGQLEAEGIYLNGQKDGEWIYYYPSGEKRAIEKYIDGLLNGDQIYFNSDGSIINR